MASLQTDWIKQNWCGIVGESFTLGKTQTRMGLIRLLSYLIIGWLVWRTLKRWYAGYQAATSADKAKTPRISSKIVKCEHCEVHLPETEAIAHEGLWFCNQKHKHAWLGRD